MPYSDNMYSMDDDSAGEDYSDQLSPSDGQFPSSSSNITPHIPNVFIPDPTLQQGTERGAESKALEAEEDRLLSSRIHSTYRHWESSSPRSCSRLEQATTATTASIPRHHHQVTYSQSSASRSPSRALPSRARSSSVYSEAPPAYSPSPISPIPSGSATTQQDRSRNYNTFGISRIMGAPEVESERLLGPQPESMGAPVDEERGTTPAWARSVHGCLPKWLNWKYAILALVVLIVSIAFLSGVSSSSSSHSNKGDDTTTKPALPIEKEPEDQVPGGGDSELPGDSESPHDPGSPGSPFQSPFCEGQQHRYDDQILSLNFERSQNLTFREMGYKNSGSITVRVGGQIDVRRLNEGDSDPRMVLEIATNDPFLRLYTSLQADVQEIKVNIPETFESTVPGQRPCVEVRGTVWVPKDGELTTLSIRAIHLGINLMDDLSLKVAGYAEVASVAGDIKAAASKSASNGKDLGALDSNPDYKFVPAKNSWAFDSRVIEVHTTSGNIEGNWPLYDMLGLHTTSGNQKVSITPQGEFETNPKSAVLSLSTVSGIISATEPVHELSRIPRLDYLVDVKSTSGSVYGAFAFGGGITVHTTASDVSLDLLPVINIDKLTTQNPAQLETVTTSGATAVHILKPVFFDGNGKAVVMDDNNNNNDDDDDALTDMASRALDCLEAKHRSTSGSIGLRYPQAWEGLLYAQTSSGRLVAKGKDLKIIKYTGGWPGSKMEARKGAVGKKSTIEVHALLGGMDAVIGDE
ncbi:hypothetical protein F4801DRAFT_595985 [Xylaria longipes]|nr:hypothetical protein F4801DRAFT_595985 [Xylaria longipes]